MWLAWVSLGTALSLLPGGTDCPIVLVLSFLPALLGLREFLDLIHPDGFLVGAGRLFGC